MRKVIQINIPKPCHEDWNKMTLEDKGRHCQVCEKTVIDFTKTTDEQIIKTLGAQGSLCGRFKKNQLDRDIVLSRKDRNNYLSFVASSLFAFLSIGTQEVKAQNKDKIIKVDSLTRQSIKDKVGTSILNKKMITGMVTDETNGYPLPFINIIIKGTTSGTQTDFDGKFRLKVAKNDILVFSYLGMKTKEIVISKQHNLHLSLTLEEDLMGDIFIVTGKTATEQLYTQEELDERAKKRKAKTKTYFKFYKRKLKEDKQKRKDKRKKD
ncbi:hypothetical protein A9Q87_00515 [Flavobacteriales bacterium 34_180_T64]|nr:hypothetical protein A9Q87_00515 [Flavobacteriales bacterium 34_180_T64]